MITAALFLLLFFLSGCATEYQPYSSWGFPNKTGGYTDKHLGDGVWEIRVEVLNAWRELALEYFERRRGEIARENGYARCETLYVVGINNTVTLLTGFKGAQAEGRIKCVKA